MTPVPANEPNVKAVVPFLHVTEMERSVRYYMDGLGFSMKYKWGRRANCGGAG
jgi:hypothetical protein